MSRYNFIPYTRRRFLRPPDKTAGKAFYAPLAAQGANRTKEKRIIILNNIMTAFRTGLRWRVPECVPQLTEYVITLPDLNLLAMTVASAA